MSPSNCSKCSISDRFCLLLNLSECEYPQYDPLRHTALAVSTEVPPTRSSVLVFVKDSQSEETSGIFKCGSPKVALIESTSKNMELKTSVESVHFDED